MPASYIEVEIQAAPDLIEQLVAILSQLGFEGFWEDGASLKCYMNESRWAPSLREEVESLVRLITRSHHSTAPKISVSTVAGRNWNEAWEKTIQPIRVTERIVITPSWHTYMPSSGEIVLTIDPKMSFGTGYHETTRLSLKLIEKLVKPGMHVLDIGTGTGVLAIASIKLGASAAVGVDTDEWSYTNALENSVLNKVQDRVSIVAGELSAVSAGHFDMIVANIQRDVIETLLPEMLNRLTPAGIMILSGLLVHDRDRMLHSLQSSGLEVVDELHENEWIAIAALRQSR